MNNVKNIDINKLQVYPNPSNGNFKITCNDITNNANIEIVNSIGQVVYKNSIANFINGAFTLNIENIVTGLYFIKVANDKNTYTRSLAISKD